MLIFSIVGYFAAVSNFLVGLGIYIYPYGNFFIPIHSLIITYAILKYQLLGIQVVIRKGIVYTILLLLSSLLYLVIVVVSEKIIQGIYHYQSPSISVFSAFLIGIVFFPLRNKIQEIVDRIVFTKTQQEIVNENLLLKDAVGQTEKLKSVAILASGMAHEIKNPLTAIKTFSEFLPKKLEDKEFLQRFSQIVGGEVDRIDQLVNQLLEFSKPAPPKFVETDMVTLIEDVLNFLSSEFIKHKIAVSKNFATAHLTLHIDPNQLKQAVLNILLNSIQAMSGGGRLTVGIQSISTNGKNLYRISISDTGPGISAADLSRIFDPFYTTKDHGTGLGLSITHGIIENHGGTIRVESCPGKGTKFVVELPV